MLSKLDERERLFVIGFVVLLIVLLLVLIFLKISQFREEISNEVEELQGSFSEIDKAIQDYNFYRSIKAGDEEKISDVFGKLDQIMVRYGLKEKIYNQRDYVNIVEKNYNRTTIEFNFKSVALQDVFKMIYDIEFNKQVSGKVTYLNFRKVPITGKELYDVNLRVSSYSRITNPKK
ncbi:MAG: hypothetical protein N3A69_12790 [Leptospiraceae bacterium]|nr:hypothetical protein [Leptospiraceae bacterium]